MRWQVRVLVPLGAALALRAGVAQAEQKQETRPTAREQAGEKAGQKAGEKAASKEMTGRVLQASPSKLFLEHMGAVVEFNIAPDAQFSGGNIRSSRDLAEGQDVRASFTVENKTTNVAKRISIAHEAGAAAPERGGRGSAETQQGAPPPKK